LVIEDFIKKEEKKPLAGLEQAQKEEINKSNTMHIKLLSSHHTL
jgi:hypothetical protein